MGFNEDLQDKTKSIALDLKVPGDSLLIIFGGIAGNLGLPPFEFGRMLGGFECKKIFVRDLSQSWYCNGLPGIADSFDGMAAYLKERAAESGAKNIVAIGNSAGGYAALLAGQIIGAHKVLSFAPQTFLSPRKRLLTLDFRWRPQIKKLYQSPKLVNKYLDLKEALGGSMEPTTKLFYCADHRLDAAHAKNLSGVKGIEFVRHPKGGHSLIKLLKESGDLERIISEAARA